jgi:3-hydroxyacyl-CoA dehydrogenase
LAQDAVVRCVEAAVSLPFADGLNLERACYRELARGKESRALRYLFVSERAARRFDGRGEEPIPAFDRVAVIGAGTMGRGIAMTTATAGFAGRAD